MTNSKSWNVDEEDDQAWDDLFPYCKEDVGDYLSPEGPDGAMPDIRSSTNIEVATYGYETEDVGILRTFEAPTENVPLVVSSTEMPSFEVPRQVEVDVAEQTTTGHISVETTKGEAAGSIFTGND